MSEVERVSVSRDYSFTVRLSPEEKATLEQLAKRFDLDKSATVRKALLSVLKNDKPTLAETGHFVPLHAQTLAFSVRLSGKEADSG